MGVRQLERSFAALRMTVRTPLKSAHEKPYLECLPASNKCSMIWRFDAKEPDTGGSVSDCLCCLCRRWHGRACAGSLCAVSWGFAGHHWRDGIGLPGLEFRLSVSGWLVGRSVGP